MKRMPLFTPAYHPCNGKHFDNASPVPQRSGVPQPPAQRKARRLVPRLLSWYGAQARDLPWRHTRDPYAIWISEIMLQQTQVATVIPYWERWMRALPTVSHLARAKPERVLKLWEGLGYYSRARNLQAAARKILNDYQGQFPTTPEAIRTLPGIGRYTTGAISSIAFNLPEPIVDGNVIRILTRLFGQRENPKTKALQNELWSLADTLVRSTKDCAALNQALMELGATVCHPRSPNCPDCPVKRSCTARKEKAIHLIPATSARPRTEARRIEVYWIARGNRILLQQRPKGFHNAGFWELPNNETSPGIPLPPQSEPLASVRHTITKYRIQLLAYAVDKPRALKGRWCQQDELESLPITASHRKLLRQLPVSNGAAQITA